MNFKKYKVEPMREGVKGIEIIRKEIIAIDIDDVCLDLLNPWLYNYNVKAKEYKIAKDIKSWKIEKYVNKPEILFGIIKSKGFLRNLPPVKGAIKSVEILYKNYDVIFVTSSRIDMEGRIERMTELFPYIDKKDIIFCVDKSYIKCDYLIDDAIHNLENTEAFTICFARTHNEAYKGKRYESWEEIIKYFNV